MRPVTERAFLRAPSPGRLRRIPNRRGVDTLVATLLMVALVVVLAAVLYILVVHYTGAASAGPNIGGGLVIAPSVDSYSTNAAIAACATAPCYFYNMTIQEAPTSLELHNLLFTVQSPNGTPFLPTGGMVALSASGAIVGQYVFATGWTVGGTVPAASELTFVLYTSGTPPMLLSNDNLQIYGVSGFTGQESVHLY